MSDRASKATLYVTVIFGFLSVLGALGGLLWKVAVDHTDTVNAIRQNHQDCLQLFSQSWQIRDESEKHSMIIAAPGHEEPSPSDVLLRSRARANMPP